MVDTPPSSVQVSPIGQQNVGLEQYSLGAQPPSAPGQQVQSSGMQPGPQGFLPTGQLSSIRPRALKAGELAAMASHDRETAPPVVSMDDAVVSRRARTQLRAATFQKAMLLPNENADIVPTTAEITRVAKGIESLAYLCDIATRLNMVAVVLVRQVGWGPIVAGVMALALTLPVQKYAVRRHSQVQQALRLSCKTKVDQLVEILVANGVIYHTQVLGLSSIVLGTYATNNSQLQGSTIFAITNLLVWMRNSCSRIPELLSTMRDAQESARSIDGYLRRGEQQRYLVPSPHIIFEDASLAWATPGSSSGNFELTHVSMNLPRGGLTVVSGATGSGKSLILMAIIGESQVRSGVVRAPCHSYRDLDSRSVGGGAWLIEGAVAYVPQSPWITEGTIRDNILFGCPWDRQRYENVLFACALKPDLLALDKGDATAIRSSGTTLSGGQISRIALARALGAHALPDRVLQSVAHAERPWLDQTPQGDIFSRLTDDSTAVHASIGPHLVQTLKAAAGIGTVLLALSSTSPKLSILGAVLLVSCHKWVTRPQKTAQRIKRLEGRTAAVAIEHTTSAIAGRATIRAFQMTEDFVQKLFTRLDDDSRTSMHLTRLNTVVHFRVNIIPAVLSMAATILMVYQNASSTKVGFTVAFTMRLAGHWLSVIQNSNQLTIEMEPTARLVEYAADIPVEIASPAIRQGSVSSIWPAEGCLEIRGLFAGHGPTLPTVLHDISFAVTAGSRVGIVGRTGSGKSTLLLALAQMLSYEGVVMVDGVDLARIPYTDVRNRIAFLPQTPLLFSGRIRENLDPRGKYDDERLLDALHKVHWPVDDGDCRPGAASFHERKQHGTSVLGFPVSAGGTNLSHGQRQLLVIARAVVAQPKILVLDEPTSSVDWETDQLIQRTLRSAVASSRPTVLMIAHRLETVIDMDRVLVLDAGRVVEYDHPARLLEKRQGTFRQMVDDNPEREAVCHI
ncbi:P-loop containing nucleoside triphosphate hydrolase protein [Aspergillus floccosus]